jgi:hypothetical protein
MNHNKVAKSEWPEVSLKIQANIEKQAKVSFFSVFARNVQRSRQIPKDLQLWAQPPAPRPQLEMVAASRSICR